MTRMIDLHAHPYLKISLFPHLANTFHAFTVNGGVWNPLSFDYQYINLRRSPVKLILNNHYVVERGFALHGLRPIAQAVMTAAFPLLVYRVVTADPWTATVKQMDGLEKAIRNTNRFNLLGGPKLKLVQSYAELGRLADDEIGVAHAIEGPHVFGYGPEKGMTPEAYWERTKKRLHYLRDRGLALLVLAHFWDNPFAPQIDSVEMVPKKKNGKWVRGRDDALFAMRRAAWKWGGHDGLGEKLVREMLTIGVLPDLSHMQEHARWAIYDLCAEYERPVLISHVGVRRYYDHEYNVSDDEIRRVRKLGGVIGMIFSNRLLVDPLDRAKTKGRGIPSLVRAMQHVREVAGDVACLGLGSDFDGFIHPMRDLYNPTHIPRLADAMTAEFSDAEIEAVFYGNSARALERGWGPKPPKREAEIAAPAGGRKKKGR
jgi:microsomal dipeptidase-like Zn-dependent dipeptidase